MPESQEPKPDKTQILGPEALREAQAVPEPAGQATVILPSGLPMLEALPPLGEEPTQALPLVSPDPDLEVRTILEGPDATVKLPAGLPVASDMNEGDRPGASLPLRPPQAPHGVAEQSPATPSDPHATRRVLPVGEPVRSAATQALPIGQPLAAEAPATHPDVRTLEIPADQLPPAERARKRFPAWAWAGLGALALLLGFGALWALRPDLLGLAPSSAEPSKEERAEPRPGPSAEAPAAPAVPPALRPYVEKAEKGDAAAMRMLGVMYYNGLNVSRNEAEGLKWYRRAAGAGSAAAAKELKLLEGKTPEK